MKRPQSRMSQISVCEREPHLQRPVLLSIENLRPLTRRQTNTSQHTLPLKVPSKQPMELSRQASQANSLARPTPAIASPTSMSATHTASPPPFPSTFPPKLLSRKYSTPLQTQRYASNASIPAQFEANRHASSYCFPPQQQQRIADNLAYAGKDLRNPFGNSTGSRLLAIENSENTTKDCLPARTSTSEDCPAIRNYMELTSKEANDWDVGRKQSPTPSRLNFHAQQIPPALENAAPAASAAWTPPRINPRTCFVTKPQHFGAYKRLPGQRPCDPPCFSTMLQNRSNAVPFGAMPNTFHALPPSPPLARPPYYNPDTSMAASGALGDSRRVTSPFLPYKPMGGQVSGRGDDEYNEFNPYNYYYH